MLEVPKLDLRLVHRHALLRCLPQITDQFHDLRDGVNIWVIIGSNILQGFEYPLKQ